MKALTRTRFGSPEVLSLKDVDIPEIKSGEFLIRVQATTVNRTDCGILRANYFVMRFFTGLVKPRHTTPGTDFAGVVQAVGKSTFGQCKPLLTKKGAYLSSELGPRAENLYLPLLTKLRGGKRVFFPFPADIKKAWPLPGSF